MRSLILNLALTSICAGVILSGCQSAAQKLNPAEARHRALESDSLAVRRANESLRFDDRKNFRYMSEAKLKSNDTRIADLKAKMNMGATGTNAQHREKIYLLEQKNKIIKIRMEAFEQSHNDWDSFRRDLDDDVDEVGRELKNLLAENKR